MENENNCGAWTVNVLTDAIPQEVQEAFDKVTHLHGATYKFLAYLGSQVVNGINHAILAEQMILDKDQTKNIVIVIINIRQSEFSLVGIHSVLHGSPSTFCGGIAVKGVVPPSAEAMAEFKIAKEGFVGSDIKPFAQLATQVVKGINYFLAAEVTPVYPKAKTTVDIITVNSMCTPKLSFRTIFPFES